MRSFSTHDDMWRQLVKVIFTPLASMNLKFISKYCLLLPNARRYADQNAHVSATNEWRDHLAQHHGPVNVLKNVTHEDEIVTPGPVQEPYNVLHKDIVVHCRVERADVWCEAFDGIDPYPPRLRK
jgi:hypothetical protein